MKFVTSLSSNTLHFATGGIALRINGVYTVVTDRYVLVLVDEFNRLRHAGRATLSGYPVPKTLPR